MIETRICSSGQYAPSAQLSIYMDAPATAGI
jgi:hypothetical protein